MDAAAAHDKLTADLSIKQQALDVQRMELEIKRMAIEADVAMAREKIESAERLAAQEVVCKMEISDRADRATQQAAMGRRIVKTIKRGPGGEVIGAEETHEGMQA
jgi:hypothetical protein